MNDPNIALYPDAPKLADGSIDYGWFVPYPTKINPFPDLTHCVTFHRGTVGYIIKRHFKRFASVTKLRNRFHDDMFQEGMLALTQSIQAWKPDRGARVNTFAYRKIYWGIRQFIDKCHKIRREVNADEAYECLIDDYDMDACTDSYDANDLYKELYQRLDKQARCVLNMRLEGHTLVKIGEAIERSKERVRQIIDWKIAAMLVKIQAERKAANV